MNKHRFYLLKKIADEMTRDRLPSDLFPDSSPEKTDDVWSPSQSSLNFINRVRDRAKYSTLEENLQSLQSFLILLDDSPPEIKNFPKRFELDKDLTECCTSLLLFHRARKIKKWIENLVKEVDQIIYLININDPESAQKLVHPLIKEINHFLNQSKTDVISEGQPNYRISDNPFLRGNSRLESALPKQTDISLPGTKFYSEEEAYRVIEEKEKFIQQMRDLQSSKIRENINSALYSFIERKTVDQMSEDQFYEINDYPEFMSGILSHLASVSNDRLKMMSPEEISDWVDQELNQNYEDRLLGLPSLLKEKEKEKIKQYLKQYQDSLKAGAYRDIKWSRDERIYYFKKISRHE
jgi:hypothetical protein